MLQLCCHADHKQRNTAVASTWPTQIARCCVCNHDAGMPACTSHTRKPMPASAVQALWTEHPSATSSLSQENGMAHQLLCFSQALHVSLCHVSIQHEARP